MRTVAAPLAATLFLVVFTVGCRPAPGPQFTPSAEVLALIDEAEDDEDREVWLAIQEQIADELAKRAGKPNDIRMLSDPEMDSAHLRLGAAVYQQRCVQCHGVNGDGKGAVAEYLYPLPRDYRKGIFKFTSTPFGARPRRSDLLLTLQRGVSGTSMPSFDRVPRRELEAVVDYVIALSQRGEFEGELAYLAEAEGELDDDLIQEAVDKVLSGWNEAESKLVLPLTRMPEMTDETIAKGRELFLSQACTKCHGQDGRGGLLGNVEVGEDVWGNKTAAADLTSGMFHGGGRPIDIYRRIYSGVNPMPAFAGTFQENPDDLWYLVHFIKDLGERRRRNQPPADFSKGAGEDAEAEPSPSKKAA